MRRAIWATSSAVAAASTCCFRCSSCCMRPRKALSCSKDMANNGQRDKSEPLIRRRPGHPVSLAAIAPPPARAISHPAGRLRGWARRQNGPLASFLGRLGRPAAMTVAPSSSSSARSVSTAVGHGSTPPGQAGAPRLDGLDGALRRRLHLAAEASGMTEAALCELWMRESLERFEAQHPVEDPDGSGRCSLRTGTCSLGPVPLPVQQASPGGAASG